MIMKLKIISFVIVLVFVVGFIFIINTSKPKLNDKSDFNPKQEIFIEDQVEQKKEATEEIKKKITPKKKSSVQKQKPVVKKETTPKKKSSVQKQKSVEENETEIKKEISATVLNYYRRGVKQIKSKQYKESLKNFNKAIELDSQFASAYYGRGYAKGGLNQFQEAIKDYDKAIELGLQKVYIYNNRGNAKYHLKQYNEAIKDYNQAIENSSELSCKSSSQTIR